MSPLYPDFLPFFMKGKTLMLWTNGKTCDLGILTRFFRTQRSQAVSSGARVPSCLYSERRQKLQIKARLSKKADKLKCQSSTSPEGAFFYPGCSQHPSVAATEHQSKFKACFGERVNTKACVVCTLLTSALLSVLQQNSPKMHLMQWAVENGK